MVFSANDRILIYELRTHRRLKAQEMLDEWPMKQWKIVAVSRLINKIDQTGSANRKRGSGRPKTVRTQENIDTVAGLVQSQEDKPHSHKTPNEIVATTGLKRSSIPRIIDNDLNLKIYKRLRMTVLSNAVRTTFKISESKNYL